MAKYSAGLLMYRRRSGGIEVFLVHPGGPFWAKKDLGAWSIPKGEYEQNEDPMGVARREFEEETGSVVSGDFIPLKPVKQSSAKTVSAWAVEGDCDSSSIKSNTFTMEWPPGSGTQQEFPEVDRAGWFTVDEAKRRILKGQLGLIDDLVGKVASRQPSSEQPTESATRTNEHRSGSKDAKSAQGSLFD